MSRFGRRGAVLAVVGFMWIVLGISVPALPDAPSRLWLLHEILPMPVRAAAWIVSGVLGLVFARQPTGRDRFGFSALIIMPLEQSVSYAVAWVVYLLPFKGDIGYRIGWVPATVWAAMCALILVCAGWPEPTPPALPTPEGKPVGRGD